MIVQRTKLGATRIRRIHIEPGTYRDGDEFVKLTEPATINLVERYHWRYESLGRNNAWDNDPDEPKWWIHKYVWESLAPVDAEEPPAREPDVRPPWYTRALIWLGLAPRIPVARVLTKRP